MIHVCLDSCPDWAEAMVTALQGYQEEVDAFPSYSERVRQAEKLWGSKRQNKPLKQQAMEILKRMCPGPGYCMFCEGSFAGDIEHFRPKTLYPELVFAWANFLYACSLCNRHKGSQFWIYRRDENILDVTRKGKAPVVPPEGGEPLLIDPRHEDPLDLIWLELLTGRFEPRHRNGLCWERATHTIELLDLNKEDLRDARCGIFEANKSLLRDILALGREGTPKDHLARKEQALRRQPHRTVWEEMKRQHKRIPELSALFRQLPEALSW